MTSTDPYLHEYFRRFGRPVDGEETHSVLFLIGSPGVSGGTYVILQHAMWLHEHGWDVEIATMLSDQGGAWHPALELLKVSSVEELDEREFDLAIATWWPTVYELPRVRARHYAYLVQSVEARFYGDELSAVHAQHLAELTYTFGLPIITIAQWMQVYLALRHRAPSFLVRNGIRKDIYTPLGPAVAPREPGKLRALVEGPLGVEMKNVDRAIQLAREGGADEVWLMSGSLGGRGCAADRVFERVPVEATPAIYRSCDVLVKLSRVEGMFGPPLEMFHCGGTAITYDVTGYDEYMVSGENSLVVPMDDEDAVVAAVRSLRTDLEFLQRLKTGAIATAARWPSWEASSEEFGRFVSALHRQAPRDYASTLLMIRGAQQEFA